MGIKPANVKSLWGTPDRIEKACSIMDYMKAGDTRALFSLLDKVNDRWDMRGLDFSLERGGTPFSHYQSDGFPSGKNKIEYRDLFLEGIDFSHSAFSNTRWYDCVFTDCLFSSVDLVFSHFDGCSFKRTLFEKSAILCDFGETEKNFGMFEDVEFKDGPFRSYILSNPRFERCRFKCNISRVDFNGSQLYDCTFEGKLSTVYFWGRPRDEWKSNKGRNDRHPNNPMMNVDFSKATFLPTFISVMFKGCDLINCIFPIKGDVFLVKDNIKVFSEVARRIDSEWKDPERKEWIMMAGFFMHEPDYPTGQVVIIPEQMKKFHDPECSQRFISLIKEIIAEQREMNEIE